MFDIAVECNIGEGRRRLQGRQEIGVKRPLALLVVEDELSALVCGGVDDHERSKHICAPRSVLVSFKEGILACESPNVRKSTRREIDTRGYHIRSTCVSPA